MPNGELPDLYVMDISYFSGKFEAYLRYKEIPYRRRLVNHRDLVATVGRATGHAQVPAMRLSDGRWLRESSAMIRYLEARQPRASVIPVDPGEAFLAALIEDYGDEWLWRPAMWWRWVPRATREHLGRRIAAEVLSDLPLPTELLSRIFQARQNLAWLRGDGMDRHASDAVRDAYPTELRSLERVLEERPFIGGTMPSIADYGYMGSMFRHFACDPDPSIVMRQRAPRVWAWVARMWSARASRLPDSVSHAPLDGPGFDGIFSRICSIYLPYLRENARALSNGRSKFDFAGGPFRFRGTRTNSHRAGCRVALRNTWFSLDAKDQAKVQARLEPYGGLAALLDEALVCDAIPAPLALPIVPPQSISARAWARLLVGDSFGT